MDASAVGRWLIDGDGGVGEIVRGGGNAAPSFMTLEVAQALVRQVRAGLLQPGDAHGTLHDLFEAGVELVPVEALATSAIPIAIELGISAYDASYVALARTYDAPLLTADRRLASVYDRAELVA